MNAELLERRASDECGCPEEDWDINGAFVTIHMESGGGGQAFIDCGDEGSVEWMIDCKDIQDLRQKVIYKVNNLPII